MHNELHTLLQSFTNLKVLVIGEAMLDVYLTGSSDRLCREAPVPIVDIKKRDEVAGGAANTAVNVATLGGKTDFLSVIGGDNEGESLLRVLKTDGVNTDHVLIDPNRQTIAKRRVVSGTQLLVRYDSGSTNDISETYEQQMLDFLVGQFHNYDAIIISDYGYGILTQPIIQTLAKLQRKMPTVVVVDGRQLDIYRDLQPTAVKPNYKEAIALLGITKPAAKGNRIEQIGQYREQLLSITHAHIVAATVDAEGALIIRRDKPAYRTYTTPVENSRAVGAGDTYVSALSLALAADATVPTASEIAATAATIVVQKEGTSYCTNTELIEAFTASSKFIQQKSRLQRIMQKAKQERKRVVFTNGCFDILHSGHVNYLNRAKTLGDILIVGLNSDESVKRLKGPARPVNTLEDRARVLSALSSVDYIVPFTDDTPIKLIEAIKPTIFVKGGDYTRETLPETSTVEKFGGKIHILPFIANYSTTSVINRIRGATL